MGMPRAYLLTWTCYGTWLHGDERGSVDMDHNGYQTPVLRKNEPRERPSAAKGERVFLLNLATRVIIEATICRHCEIRGWTLVAINVRTNHVHVVVVIGEVSPEDAMSQFKAWCTRKLREAGHVGRGANVWTEHGSTRYLWEPKDVDLAAKYVRDWQ